MTLVVTNYTNLNPKYIGEDKDPHREVSESFHENLE